MARPRGMFRTIARGTALIGIMASIAVPGQAANAAVVPAGVAGMALVAPPGPAAAISGSTSGDVVARWQNPDGTVAITTYHAAPGFSAARLYQSLRSAGVKGLIDPATVRPMDSFGCYYNTSVGLNGTSCPAVHWTWNGFSDPQVYFNDSTSAAWPVDAAVHKWNEAVGVDSYYQWKTTPCPALSTGKHCVRVSDQNYGTTGDWAGVIAKTGTLHASNGDFLDGLVNVYFNDAYSSAQDNRSTACHELGHALGLGDNYNTSSCMYWSSLPGTDPMYPSSDDFHFLANVAYAD